MEKVQKAVDNGYSVFPNVFAFVDSPARQFIPKTFTTFLVA